MDEDKKEEILLEVARLIWRQEITISEFLLALGIDMEKLDLHDLGEFGDLGRNINTLAGIFKGWENQPE